MQSHCSGSLFMRMNLFMRKNKSPASLDRIKAKPPEPQNKQTVRTHNSEKFVDIKLKSKK